MGGERATGLSRARANKTVSTTCSCAPCPPTRIAGLEPRKLLQRKHGFSSSAPPQLCWASLGPVGKAAHPSERRRQPALQLRLIDAARTRDWRETACAAIARSRSHSSRVERPPDAARLACLKSFHFIQRNANKTRTKSSNATLNGHLKLVCYVGNPSRAWFYRKRYRSSEKFQI